MSRNIEIEFKNVVTFAEFQLFLRTFNIQNEQFSKQINHYFDTDDFSLKEMSSALRIRELNDNFELTLKKPEKIGLLEINQLLTQAEAKALLAGGAFPEGAVNNELRQMNLRPDDLALFGSLTTKRAEIEYRKGLLVFDHSFYLGKEDYEIEYEVDDWVSGNKIFTDLMTELNIEVKTAESKIRRLFRAKQAML